MSDDSTRTVDRRELDERLTELASSVATTELWCGSAQTALYDARDALRRAEQRNRDFEAVLAGIYRSGTIYETERFVARLCDEKLDTSGALLGRVRELATEIGR